MAKVVIYVEGIDRPGLLRDVSSSITGCGGNIIYNVAHGHRGKAYLLFITEMRVGLEEIRRLISEMDKYWTLEKLTWLVYEIPKKPWFSEQEKKKAQRNFFKNVYRMLIGADTGPRLPTFLLALGKEKVKYLLDVEKNECKTK